MDFVSCTQLSKEAEKACETDPSRVSQFEKRDIDVTYDFGLDIDGLTIGLCIQNDTPDPIILTSGPLGLQYEIQSTEKVTRKRWNLDQACVTIMYREYMGHRGLDGRRHQDAKQHISKIVVRYQDIQSGPVYLDQIGMFLSTSSQSGMVKLFCSGKPMPPPPAPPPAPPPPFEEWMSEMPINESGLEILASSPSARIPVLYYAIRDKIYKIRVNAWTQNRDLQNKLIVRNCWYDGSNVLQRTISIVEMTHFKEHSIWKTKDGIMFSTNPNTLRKELSIPPTLADPARGIITMSEANDREMRSLGEIMKTVTNLEKQNAELEDDNAELRKKIKTLQSDLGYYTSGVAVKSNRFLHISQQILGFLKLGVETQGIHETHRHRTRDRWASGLRAIADIAKPAIALLALSVSVIKMFR